jgi:hypothetical protein
VKFAIMIAGRVGDGQVGNVASLVLLLYIFQADQYRQAHVSPFDLLSSGLLVRATMSSSRLGTRYLGYAFTIARLKVESLYVCWLSYVVVQCRPRGFRSDPRFHSLHYSQFVIMQYLFLFTVRREGHKAQCHSTQR